MSLIDKKLATLDTGFIYLVLSFVTPLCKAVKQA